MATEDALDLHVDDFATTWQLHLAAKANRNAGYTEADAAQRAVAEWADLLDDFLLAAQLLVRGVYRDAGSPEGVQAAPPGSIYLRTDGGAGSSIYVKESGEGTTGWSVVRTIPEGTWANISAGAFAASSGWGTPAAVVTIDSNYPHSTWRRGRVVVTTDAAGGSFGASPTLTLTFPELPRRPFGFARQNGGSGTTQNTFWTTTTTTLVITYGGTPAGSRSYIFDYEVIP